MVRTAAMAQRRRIVSIAGAAGLWWLGLLGAGCELIVDFDRDRIPDEALEDATVAIRDGGDSFDANLDAADGGNHAPEAEDDANANYATETGITLHVPADEGVLSNDRDRDGDELKALLLEEPGKGTLVLEEDGSFTYLYGGNDGSLAEGSSDAVTFKYRASDGEALSDPATVTLIVTGSDAPAPLADDDDYTVSENETLDVPAAAADSLPSNDTGVDDAPLTFSVLRAPRPDDLGTLELETDGSFTFKPSEKAQQMNDGENAIVDFIYEVSSGGRSDAGQVKIEIVGENGAPEIGSTTLATAAHTQLVGPEGALLEHIVDEEGDDITLVPIEGSETEKGGEITVGADGSYEYLPPLGVTNIEDSFVLEVSDGQATASATLQISVQGPLIWYVDNSYDGPSDGRSHQPLTDLTAAVSETAGEDEIIYVRAGAESYPAVSLKPGQQLIGAGADLSADLDADEPTILFPAGEAPNFDNAPASGIVLADRNEVAGIHIRGSGEHGILGNATSDVWLHDLEVSQVVQRGISLNGATGTVRIDRVQLRDLGTDGLAVAGGTATVTLQDVSIEHIHAGDAAPQGIADQRADAYGVRLQENSGAFSWRGGSVRLTGNNRNTALFAQNIAELTLAGNGTDQPLTFSGAGRNSATGLFPSTLLVSGATSVTLEDVAVENQAAPEGSALGAAVALAEIDNAVTVQRCRFGSVGDDAEPLAGHGIVLTNQAVSGAFNFSVRDTIFIGATAQASLADAIYMQLVAQTPGAVQVELSNIDVALAERLVALSLVGPSDDAHSVAIERLTGTSYGNAAISATIGDRAAVQIEIAESELNGRGGEGASGANVIHEGTHPNSHLDLSIHDSAFSEFGSKGIELLSRGLNFQALIADNQLTDDGRAVVAVNGAALLLRTEADGSLDATVRDNQVDWSQHTLLARATDYNAATGTPGSGNLCLDAHGNSGLNDDNSAPPEDLFFDTTSGIQIGIQQASLANLESDNNGVTVNVGGDALQSFGASCATVQD